MENFFVEDEYYTDLGDLMDDYEIEDPSTLPDDYKIEAMSSVLKYVHQFTTEQLLRVVDDERLDEDGTVLDKIEWLIENELDLDKFNEKMPKLYYPGGEDITITKQDLIDYVG